ncbi:MAG: septation protein IspZ [Kordiimonadaceae bacterium]|jgi:intracellular septation protein|nr:septation protein IspZ [Kordiimonadaceae bacterium]MBT6037575.1 septation protein IspZ [Kordiimonadaceae bacterium]
MSNEPENKKGIAPQLIKFIIEIGPIIVFFVANKYFSDEDGLGGAIPATMIFMCAFAVSMICSKIILKNISKMLWVSGILIGFFGGLTIYFNDPTFIKIKPTILYSLFSAILLSGYMMGKPFLKNVMAVGFPPLEDIAWMKMSRNWGLYFIGCAILNEILWRNFTMSEWIAMKGYIFMPLSFVFALAQMPIIMKHQLEETTED